MSRESQIQERLKQMPESQRKTYLKAAQGKGSPRNAIKAFCCECTGYDRQEVTLCTDKGCPLFLFRPFKNAPVERYLNVESKNPDEGIPFT